MIIRAKAPVRISFGSAGDTDYYINLVGTGFGLNATIDKYSYCEIHQRKDDKIVLRSLETGHVLTLNSIDEIGFENRELNIMKAVLKHFGNTGIEVVTYTDAPLESGLGGSASHTVSMIKAFSKLNNKQMSNEEIAKLAYHIERDVLGIEGGYQDQWAAAYGGLNYLEFTKEGVKLHPLLISEKELQNLEKNLLLIFIPRKEKGSDVHKHLEKDSKENLAMLDMKKENVKKMRNAIEERRFDDIGEIINMDWKIKKQMTGLITNTDLDRFYQKVLENGATGGRLIGAGAGGCFLFYCKNPSDVKKILPEFNAKIIPFRFQRNKLDINCRDQIEKILRIHNQTINKILSDSEIMIKMENVIKKIIECYKNGGKVVLFGNGGSAADAQHIATELVSKLNIERPMLNAISLTVNTSILTAIANDYSYDKVFSKQIKSLVHHGDVIIGLSTSGTSKNVIEGIKTAKEKDITTVGLTGRSGGDMKDLVDILINVPSDSVQRIQEVHISIGHIICELVEKELYG